MRRREPSATRRGFLALAGSATLAGCNGVRSDLFGEEEAATLDGSELREMANRPVPTVPPVAPVGIERSYLDAKAKRARDLLASVPNPLGPDEIPNGAIRREVTEEREAAERSLEAAANASSPLDAMDRLRSARESARYVAAAWKAIDRDLGRTEATAGRGALRDGIDAFRDEWRYVGADPIRAVLVHRIVEGLVESATAYAERDDRSGSQPESAPAVGEAASRLERARASLDDATYVHGRFLASVDEPRDLRPTFERVAASLIEAQRERRDALPGGAREDPSRLVDRDVGDTPAAELLEAFYHDVTRWRADREEWEDDEMASVILRAHRRDARFRAFDSVRERIENGEDFAVDEASDVAGFRESAVSAVEGALDSDRYPRLVRNELADEAREIGYADERFSDSDDEVRASYIGYHAVRYVEIAATARAVPAASERVGSALDSA